MRKEAADKKLKKNNKSAKKPLLKQEKAISDITKKILDRNRIEQVPRFNEALEYSQTGEK